MARLTRPHGRNVRFRLCRAALGAVLLLALAGTAVAQEARGTITGTVRDASKGVIPGASVTITNVAMGTSVPVTTNEVGWFQATYLIPGTYRVAVELSGFKKFLREVEVGRARGFFLIPASRSSRLRALRSCT